MKLVLVTDTHLVPPGGRLYGLDPEARLAACLDEIKKEHGDASLLVFLGDLADTGDPAAYALLRGLLDGFPIPWRLMLGNHDRRAAFRDVFDDHPVDSAGFVQSAMDVGGERLVFLDTLDEGSGAGRLCDQRLAWLSDQLDEARDRPVTVFLHHPPRSVGMTHFENILLRAPDAFLKSVRRHGRVRQLLFGHLHLTVSGVIDGIPFACNRGTCHQILPTLDHGQATFVEGAPVYGVALFGPAGVTVHDVETAGGRPVLYLADEPAPL